MYRNKMFLRAFIFMLLMFWCLQSIKAQQNKSTRTSRGITFSMLILTFGTYQANKYPAKFYNGASENQNTLDYIFSNYYWRQEIRELLDAHVNRDSFIVAQIPEDIRYRSSLHGGVGIIADYRGIFSITINVITTRLKINDVVPLEVFPPFNGMVQSYVYCSLVGAESRTTINLGLLRKIQLSSLSQLFFEGGFLANYSRVLYHKLIIFEREYNMVNIYGNVPYVPNTSMQEFDVHQGGIGFGLFFEPGFYLNFASDNHIGLSVPLHLNTVRLEPYHERMTFSYGLNLKLMMPLSTFTGSKTFSDEVTF